MFGWQTRLSSWIRVSVCQSAGSEVSHYLSSRKKQMRASVFDVLFSYRTRGSLSLVPSVKFQKLAVPEEHYHRFSSLPMGAGKRCISCLSFRSGNTANRMPTKSFHHPLFLAFRNLAFHRRLQQFLRTLGLGDTFWHLLLRHWFGMSAARFT
jgi:hypothetical protein